MSDTSKPSQAQLQADFERGRRAAMDPTNNPALAHGGAATTTLSSYWLHTHCPVCEHSFRLGDEVYVSSDRSVRHRSALLPCTERADTAEQQADMSAFFRGLNEEWPPPEGVRVERLTRGHRLLAPPQYGFQRPICVVCGHTFRPDDHVVICPCSPQDPKCQTAIHRDPAHRLHCLEAWNPGANKQIFCPVTLRKLYE